MSYYRCPDCEQLFHEPRDAEYVWCKCGQPLTGADLVPGLAEPGLAASQPAAAEPVQPAAAEPVDDLVAPRAGRFS
jgi:hypothetical protein